MRNLNVGIEIPRFRFGVTLLFAFFIILLITTTAIAQTSGYRLKLVFPFGEDHKQRICPIDYRTLDGCCEAPDAIYTHTGTERIGCCRKPNEILTVGKNTRCCLPETAELKRYGQTADAVCGKLCDITTKEVVEYQGKSECCAKCEAGHQRLEQTLNDMCGICIETPVQLDFLRLQNSVGEYYVGKIGPYPIDLTMNIVASVDNGIRITGGINWARGGEAYPYWINQTFTLPKNTIANFYVIEIHQGSGTQLVATITLY